MFSLVHAKIAPRSVHATYQMVMMMGSERRWKSFLVSIIIIIFRGKLFLLVMI